MGVHPGDVGAGVVGEVGDGDRTGGGLVDDVNVAVEFENLLEPGRTVVNFEPLNLDLQVVDNGLGPGDPVRSGVAERAGDGGDGG